MSKRLNIVLPESTVKTIDRLARPGERSRFIDKAVQHYVSHQSTEAVRARLEQTAVRDRDIDRQVADEWLAVDYESWQQLEEPRATKRTPSAVKSTSRRSIRR